MQYEKLEQIATLLYGNHWKTELANHFGKTRSMAFNWEKQGVPQWVEPSLVELVEKRLNEILRAKEAIG